jgi:hypothetical protein
VTGRLLLAGPRLAEKPALLARVIDSLGGPDRIRVVEDDGWDLAWAIEAGATVGPERRERFLAGFVGARELVVVEGLLHTLLREHLPKIRVRGLAEALLETGALTSTIGPRDLLVIDARGYHADHARLVRLFGDLRARTRCHLNLDLQRMAIPTCADSLQARADGHESCATAVRWMLEGRDVDRIVVESPADLDLLAASTDLPVVHLSTLTPAESAR